jgi:DNA-binding YbaB/EbfC family protein
MGSGYSKMKKQARAMQQQVDGLRENMKKTEATGSAGNGLVTVTIDGGKNVKKISIKPECVTPDDVEGLQDLIVVAFHDAHQQIEEISQTMKSPW